MRFALACLLVPSLFAQFHRDWTSHPAVVQLDTAQDIYAVGDAHADASRLSAVLQGAKLLAHSGDRYQWTGGKSVLVVTGDFIDKGDQPLQVIALLRALQTAAANAGGRVIILAGNHEVEFLASPHAKKSSGFVSELKRARLDPAAVAACQGDLGAFFCGLPFAARVNAWFFSHGGNTHGQSMARLIADLQSGVDRDGFATPMLLDPDSLLEARLGDDPWFARHGADPRKTLASYAAALGVAHFVQGHQPSLVTFPDRVERQAGELFERYGLLFLEDTGMSRGVNHSAGAILRIGAAEAWGICPDGSSVSLWNAASNPDIGRMPPCRAKD